jgi:hypothetical protein
MMRASKASDLENMQAPSLLRGLKGWLVWRWVQRPGKAKASKVPYYITGEARRGAQGSESDRAKMATFEEAKAFAIRHNFPGVGFAFMPEFGITGLDFDDCVIDGKVDTLVEQLTAGTYTEYSPSGNGVHAFVLGAYPDHKDSPPRNPDRDKFGCETFQGKGFLTFTGLPTDLTEATGDENSISPLPQHVVDYFGTRFVHVRALREKYEGDGKPVFGFSEEQIEGYLKALPEDLSYDEWVKVGMAVHHETYGEGFALWDEWSATSPKYTDSAYSLARWESFGVNNSAEYTTMGTVLQMLRQNGVETGLEVADVSEFEFLPSPKGGKFRITEDDEFASQEVSVQWLIKGFLLKAELGMLFGESGAGKSFATLDMCAAICRGVDFWNGHRVKKGRVLYVVAEGVSGFRQRLRAYCHQHAIPKIGMDVIYEVTPNLVEASQVTDLIKEICEREPYDLIVMDTFARVVAGADENSGQEMGNAILQCKRISQKAKAMVLLVHHSGKDTSKGPRGWSGITAACDSEIVVERNNDMRSITARKVKEGVDGISYLFSLHTVVLGVDEDGDDITSCIVEFKGDGKVKAEPKKKTGANELAFLDALHNVLGMGDMKAGVDTARVQEKFCEDFDPSKRQSYKNQSFKRAKDTLLDKGSIFEENGMLFLGAENADT